jgi:hypothetical protein
MTWYPGAPLNTDPKKDRFYDLVIRVTFKTYKERMSSAIGSYETANTFDPSDVRLRFARSGETLNRM